MKFLSYVSLLLTVIITSVRAPPSLSLSLTVSNGNSPFKPSRSPQLSLITITCSTRMLLNVFTRLKVLVKL